MKMSSDGSTEWTKEDCRSFAKWRAKELGLTIKVGKTMVEIKGKGITLLGVENGENWPDQADLFLMGYEWGHNSVSPNKLFCGRNNFPPYARLMKRRK